MFSVSSENLSRSCQSCELEEEWIWLVVRGSGRDSLFETDRADGMTLNDTEWKR